MRKNLYLLLTCLGLTLPALAETPKTFNGKLVDEDSLTLYVLMKILSSARVPAMKDALRPGRRHGSQNR
ncbi:hypothetical protein ACIPF8_18700 [Collimonas sp. NPDC087041]|uniref:hypothetical protein n=1 Tax=Collimonas sp. NPDC087041 TaxID=3363960 RepID=UPI00380E5B11